MDGAGSPEGKGSDIRLAGGQTVKIQLGLRNRMPAAHGLHGEALNQSTHQKQGFGGLVPPAIEEDKDNPEVQGFWTGCCANGTAQLKGNIDKFTVQILSSRHG